MLITAGCAPPPAPLEAPLARTDRPGDGLLTNPVLQQLVEHQLDRNAGDLTPYLGHEDPVVRARAALALGSVQDAGTARTLLPLLTDIEANVRADAAFALGQSGDSAFADTLLASVSRETDAVVRNRLLEAVGKTGTQRHLEVLAGTPAPEPAKALAIARFGNRNVHHPIAVEWLTARLGADSALTRRNAAYYFGRVGTTDPWRHVADRVRGALDSLAPGDPAAMYLVTALGRLAAVEDLDRIALRLLQDPDWRVRAAAATALRPLGSEAPARAALFDALDDRNRHVSISAIETLGDIGDLTESDISRLERWTLYFPRHPRLLGRGMFVLATRRRAAGLLGWFRHNLDGPPDPVAEATPALGPLTEPEALEILIGLTNHEESHVSVAALRTLRDRWTSRAGRGVGPRDRYFDAFRSAVMSDDPARVAAAAPALSQPIFRELGSVAALREAYQRLDDNALVGARIALVRALGASRDPNAQQTLRTAAQADDPLLRAEAAASLQRLTAPPGTRIQPAERPRRPIDWEALGAIGPSPHLRITTARGDVLIRLLTEEAPLTVQTIVALADRGRFDGVPFHRVIANFVAQGGNVSVDGMPARYLISSEFTRLPYERGVIGMASAGKDTETTQYFVTHSPQPHLDGAYTAFGWTVEGFDVLDAIVQNDRAVHVSVVR